MKPHYKSVPPQHWPHARRLRDEATPAEELLWQALRHQQLGVKFRRQHPFGPFFLDSHASELRLVVELDGSIHNLEEIRARDAEREQYLQHRQRLVVRFRNEEVLESLDAVLGKLRGIIAELKASHPIPGPSPLDVEKGEEEIKSHYAR